MRTFYPEGADNRVEVIEVGTRDGLQIEKKIIPAAQKIELINLMIEAGIKNIEVTSFVSPKAVPQLADAEQVLAGIARRPDTNLMALVPNLRAAERAIRTTLDGGVILCSASETHNRKNLNRDIDESLQGMSQVVDMLRKSGKQTYAAIATAFGCPFEGDVALETVLKIARTYIELGVKHITLGDTTGMATPANIQSTVNALNQAFPSIELCLHLHNTRGIGLANVLAGLTAGVRRFDSSVGGLGGCPFAAGATGNICTEDLLFLLEECGWNTGVDLSQAIRVAQTMELYLDRPLSGQVMRAGSRLHLHSAEDVATATA